MTGPLPGWAVDLIRDGLPPAVLATPKTGGARAVYKALVSTAVAALNADRTQSEWQDLLTADTSALARQHRLRDGRTTRSPLSVQKDLDKAWTTATTWLTNQDAPWTRDDLAHEVKQRVEAARMVCADADAPLTDTDRRVLAYAADEAERRGMTRVTLPRRAVMEATGANQKAVRVSLPRLVDRGLLEEVSRGRPGAPGATGVRAAIYALRPADALAPYLCRETRPMGPSAQTYGPPGTDTPGPHAQTYGPHPAPRHDQPQGAPVDRTVTITAASPEELVALLDLIRSYGADVQQAEPSRPPLTVVRDAPRNAS